MSVPLPALSPARPPATSYCSFLCTPQLAHAVATQQEHEACQAQQQQLLEQAAHRVAALEEHCAGLEQMVAAARERNEVCSCLPAWLRGCI